MKKYVYLKHINKKKLSPSMCITESELTRKNKCLGILSKEKITRNSNKKYKNGSIGYQRWLELNKDHDCNISELSADKICQVKECYNWSKKNKINLF